MAGLCSRIRILGGGKSERGKGCFGVGIGIGWVLLSLRLRFAKEGDSSHDGGFSVLSACDEVELNGVYRRLSPLQRFEDRELVLDEFVGFGAAEEGEGVVTWGPAVAPDFQLLHRRHAVVF